MSGRISGAMERAIEIVVAGEFITRAAAKAGVDPSALRRRLRALGFAPRPSPKGPRGPRRVSAEALRK